MKRASLRPRPRLRVLLTAVAVCAALGACSSREDRIASGLRKGTELLQQADWDKAGVEVRNVLQIDPKNAPAHLLAAQISEGQREVQRAYGQYAKALELQPGLVDAQAGMARLLLVTGDRARAQQLVNEVLAAAPQHARARTLQAALLAAQGQAAQAQQLAEDVLKSPDAPVDTSLTLAALHSNAQRWPQALQVLDAALQKHPRDMDLIQAAVQVTAAAGPGTPGMAGKAEAYFRRATEAAPRNHDLWLSWARYHLATQEVDKAEAVMRAAVQAQPDDGKRRLALLEFVRAVRGNEAAEKAYLAAIDDKPRDMSVRFGLAQLYASTARPAQAKDVLLAVLDKADDTPSLLAARNQLAALHIAAGQPAEARKLIEEVLKSNPRDAAALVMRGRMHLAEGRARDAVADLRGALRDQPGAVEVVQLLAQAHQAAGEPALARDALAEGVKQRPREPALRALLATAMAVAGEHDAAQGELDQALRLMPQAAPLYQLKAQLAAARRDYAGAQATLERYAQAFPQEADPHVRLGRLLTQQGRTAAALQAYDAGVAAAPADPAPFLAGVALLGGLKRYDEALARIATRDQQQPNNRAVHLQVRGEVLALRGDLNGAERAYREALALAPGQLNAYLGLARVQRAQGRSDEALKLLADGARALPQERVLPMLRAEILTQAGRHDDAIAAYEQLARQHPEDDAVANNLAYLLAEFKGDRASTERALQLASRFASSRNAGHLDSLGWIHYQLGQYDKARPLLEKAVSLASPPSALMQLHLGKALVKTGDTERGRALIRQALAREPKLPRGEEARALLAQG